MHTTGTRRHLGSKVLMSVLVKKIRFSTAQENTNTGKKELP